MKITHEQEAIIHQAGNMRVNACAGSGKTTTLILYAAYQPPTKRILYLAFNKTVRMEAQTRFLRKGVRNVDVHTAHSLAYRYTVGKGLYQLNPSGAISLADLIDYLSLNCTYGQEIAPVMAAHIRAFFNYYCNSAARTLSSLHYRDRIDPADRKARKFVQKYEGQITHYTDKLIAAMTTGKLPVTHDFYLKAFQLADIDLPYDIILFDEGQDASETMLAVFERQAAVKVIVGDQHQQIYGFRYAINSMQRLDFPTRHLSQSFRFGADTAELANRVLGWKTIAQSQTLLTPITGLCKVPANAVPTHATIGRTNLSVLAQAIEALCIREDIGSLYFEGRFDTYTYMENGASLYDILNLHLGKSTLVKNPILKQMYNTEALREYIDLTGDRNFKVALDVVETYETDLPHYIAQIREAHMSDGERMNSDRIFSTVHRCKGLEYDGVQIEDDFINLPGIFDRLEIIKNTPGLTVSGRSLMQQRLAEEVNMLYVGITRSMGTLHLPEQLQKDLRGQSTTHRERHNHLAVNE